RYVIERRQSSLRTVQQKTEILGMGIRAANQEIEDLIAKEGRLVHRVLWRPGVQQSDDRPDSGATVRLIAVVRVPAERLAHVLLVYALQPSVFPVPVVP